MQSEPLKHDVKRKFAPYFAVLLSAVVLALAVLMPLSWYNNNLRPADPMGRPRLFVVDRGKSAAAIAQSLERDGFIRSAFAFRVLARRSNAENDIKAGTYRISSAMSLKAILNHFVSGQVFNIKVTIPEGLTSRETAALLKKKNIIKDTKLFLNEVAGKKLDGRLFPETYQFSPDVSEAEVVAVMAQRFNDEVVDATGKTEFDTPEFKRLLVLASIIEKEAKVPSDRPIIASVFINRLQKGIKLESCATVQYALGQRRTRLLYTDLKINSPYNTYLVKDLPPGPICSPGIASIKAALFPAKTEYYFFVAGPDGKHVFSKTYSEHLAAQKRLNISSEAGLK
jgi:UPF0755 protein